MSARRIRIPLIRSGLPALALLTGAASVLASNPVVARWALDGDAAPHVNAVAGGAALALDPRTSAPGTPAGVDGSGARLAFSATPGVSTRLAAYDPAVQRDTFGFSLWLRPVYLTPFDNIAGKEMAATAAGPAFSRVAWQLHVLDDDGTGTAAVELVVRGSDRARGDHFGSVASAVRLPLRSESENWIHLAGGYDAATGRLTLRVDGREASAAGAPGANLRDGGAFVLGSMVNGADFVAYAAAAEIDEVRLHASPIDAYDAARLRAFPTRPIDPPFAVTRFEGAPQTDLRAAFNSEDGWYYDVEVSKDLQTFAPVATVRGVGASTEAFASRAAIDAVLGPDARDRVFARVAARLPDADGSLGLAPASIRPFANPSAYVPQYHYSLPGASVGDPCGVVRWRDEYYLFTWDLGLSRDLVDWRHAGWPMRNTPAGAGMWTGSVVVDVRNTSGLGTAENPPMVAIYTIHNNTTKKETVGLASSVNYRDFYQYPGNPVATADDTVFRDPEVFWHEPTQRWVMLVSRSAAQSIRFFTSPNLKDWTHVSDFGPVGARSEFWEVAGLAEVPIRGRGNQKKWLLFISAGTNKIQYFAGHFDGTRFTMDEATRAFVEDGAGLEGDLFANFENTSYADAGWTTTGTAFGTEPAARWQNPSARGFLGQRLASSAVDGDWRAGSTLTSPAFTITKNNLNFLVGGGAHAGRTCINLLVDGQIVRTATGDNSDVMRAAGWNVAEFRGRSARIQLVDDYDGFWGRIFVDQIRLSDSLDDSRREHAAWVDHGSDFYAAKVLRDFDGKETDVKWTAWIGNWTYEAQRPVPQGWGKGAESIFRRIQLVDSPRGFELVQEPIPAQQTLRGPLVEVAARPVSGVAALPGFAPSANVYELQAVFDLADAGDTFGLNLCVGGGQKLVLGYDTVAGTVFLDRRQSGNTGFSPAFANVTAAPFRSKNGRLKLHVFLDQSSVEVFVNDGERVLTSQIYPDPARRGVEVFSTGRATRLLGARAWPLASIWD